MQMLTDKPAWKALNIHHAVIGHTHLRQFFFDEPARGEHFCAEAAGIYLDYSKNRITAETLRLLFDLANECGLPERIEAMFQGEKINVTERRAVLHTALRAPETEAVFLDGVDVVPEVQEVLDCMTTVSSQLRSGVWKGYTGKRIRNIINIGIGGSDLGPAMAYEALRYYSQPDITFHFISNMDSTDFVEATRDLDPEETLFILCSKTFTTTETLMNSSAAREWILGKHGDAHALQQHFLAVTSNGDGAIGFGIPAENIFKVWDWVGGRYAMDSAMGLSTMIAIGSEHFRDMLGGFHAMDLHFRHASLDYNLPTLLGLLSIWNANFLGAATVAVLPYEQYLKYFPTYLQQLTMESNGKSVTCDGEHVNYSTGPIYWGEPGTKSQHSFFQLLHQGTQLIPSHLIGFCKSMNPLGDQHDLLMANMFAQSEALAFGKTHDEVKADAIENSTEDRLVPHRCFDGNQPSTTLLAEQLDPYTLGALVALYEHSVFVQGVIWNINSFDQWGVELGKALAKRTAAEVMSNTEPELKHDSSTNSLIHRYRTSQSYSHSQNKNA